MRFFRPAQPNDPVEPVAVEPSRFVVTNEETRPIRVGLEIWGEYLDIEPGASAVFALAGPDPIRLQIMAEETGVTVWVDSGDAVIGNDGAIMSITRTP